MPIKEIEIKANPFGELVRRYRKDSACVILTERGIKEIASSLFHKVMNGAEELAKLGMMFNRPNYITPDKKLFFEGEAEIDYIINHLKLKS